MLICSIKIFVDCQSDEISKYIKNVRLRSKRKKLLNSHVSVKEDVNNKSIESIDPQYESYLEYVINIHDYKLNNTKHVIVFKDTIDLKLSRMLVYTVRNLHQISNA